MAKKTGDKKPGGDPSLILRNKKAWHDYNVLETLECGVALKGTEVKSLRNRDVNFGQAFVLAKNGKLTLLGLHIAPYKQGNIMNHEPERPRQLLAHKREIRKLQQKVQEKGRTLTPLRLYWKFGRAKVEVGLCRGKQAHDKRDTLREKDLKRRIARETDRRR
ncbi:MAG: SsrA-binding protein SmpB [Planctomycetota bacterium]